MKKKDVAIGKKYIAKVSNKLVEVQLVQENPFGLGGWRAKNLSTGREIFVKTAARLRREVQ